MVYTLEQACQTHTQPAGHIPPSLMLYATGLSSRIIHDVFPKMSSFNKF
jgi:hypothetical protein